MKSQDKTLFAFPLILIFFVIISAGALFVFTKKFEESYVAAEKRGVMLEAQFVASLISPMLIEGDVERVAEFCEGISEKSRRITLVDSAGTVLADSDADKGILDNHAHREEIAIAIAGTPGSSIRFSSTQNERMIYCAMPIDATLDGKTNYVLRVAVYNKDVESVISGVKTIVLLALAIGGISAIALACYIIFRIRIPLIQLQESAKRISRGNLDERISIPAKGFVRELALPVSRMKEQLKQQLDRITADRNDRENLFSALSEAVLLINEDREAIYFNSAARKIFNIDTASTQFNWRRCGSADLLKLSEIAFSESRNIETEVTLNCAGTQRSLYAKGGIILHDGKRCLLLAITDMTNLRRLESFRSDFVANVSHEIKTPLTSILSAVESLRDGALNSPEFARKFLKILSTQGKRLNALIQDILSLAALERREISGKKEFESFQLDAALENAVNACTENAEAADISLCITRNDTIEYFGDSQLIEQAIINLVGNAIKYSASPKIEISLERQGANAVIAVKDFGIGIPAEHLPRLFERFYRVHKERSQKLGGTGLGLAIVKHIAQLHGGSASAESKPGTGSTFRIILPL